MLLTKFLEQHTKNKTPRVSPAQIGGLIYELDLTTVVDFLSMYYADKDALRVYMGYYIEDIEELVQRMEALSDPKVISGMRNFRPQYSLGALDPKDA